jgi:hypothetical protein
MICSYAASSGKKVWLVTNLYSGFDTLVPVHSILSQVNGNHVNCIKLLRESASIVQSDGKIHLHIMLRLCQLVKRVVCYKETMTI